MLDLADAVARPSGLFELRVFRRGLLVEEWEAPNLVVGTGRAAQARLLGAASANDRVSRIAYGTSGTAPADGNTALTSAYGKALDGVSYPSATSVRFAFSLGVNEANGKAILEFGLLTEAGALYARKVRTAALNKDSDLTLSGSWTITF